MFIDFVFILSFLSKAGDIRIFEATIQSFVSLRGTLVKLAALFFLAAELSISVLLSLGGDFLIIGFSLAILLLIVFTAAIVSVLSKETRPPCNCFGLDNRAVSPYEIGRNAGLGLCSITGLVLLLASSGGLHQRLTSVELGSLLMAAAFTLIWVNLRYIVEVFMETK